MAVTTFLPAREVVTFARWDLRKGEGVANRILLGMNIDIDYLESRSKNLKGDVKLA